MGAKADKICANKTSAQIRQEAQLPQRNSASAAHMEGGWG